MEAVSVPRSSSKGPALSSSFSRLAFGLLSPLLATSMVAAQDDNTIGVVVHEKGIEPGYTLFAPLTATTDTFLVDDLGRVVQRWTSEIRPGNSVYLLDDGDLLRTLNPGTGSIITAGGAGGMIERRSWDDELEWSFSYISDEHRLHHDVEVLPNGNVLAIAWEYRSGAEALGAGRIPGTFSGSLWPDKIVEIRPDGVDGGTIVWEWRAWDHLVQNHDPGRPNYGDPADHPHRIDVNHRLNASSDWLHFNGIDYNPELDQILISCRSFNEIWVVDHGLTTEEAAGPAGDLLYRWGNPQAYGRGTAADQTLFRQHDARWIRPGMPGHPGITIFNNGNGRPEGDFSSVDEILPPLLRDGTYDLRPGRAFAPAEPVWSYVASVPTDFYSSFISGAERLSNGNTLICAGATGEIFEVRPDGTEVWRYITPLDEDGPMEQGEAPPVGNGGTGPGAGIPNTIFRAERYRPDHPGLAGRDLVPGPPIEILPPCPGDLDHDRRVGPADLGSLLIAWGTTAVDADLDGDGLVGAGDLGLILVGWGPCP